MKLAGTTAVTEIWAKIKAYITTELSNHTSNVSNPHGVSYLQLNDKITCMGTGTTWRKIILSFTITALVRHTARFDFTYYAKHNNSWNSRGDILLSILFTSSTTWASNLSVTNWYGDIPNFYLIDNGSGSFQFAISNDNLNPWVGFDIYLKHMGGDVNTHSYGDQGSTTSGILMSKSIGTAYTVGALTITKNGTSVGTFNGSANTTIALTDTTYSDVTTTTHGLMTATDKVKLNVIADTYSTKESTSTSVGLDSNGSGSYNINFYNASGTRLFTLSNSDIITLLTTGSMPSNIKAYADVSGVALSNRCSRIALTSNGYSFYNESGSVMFNVTNSMLFSLAQSFINSNAGADFLVHAQSALHLRSSAWDWEGEGPTGTGSRVLHIATISGLGLIHIKGIHSIGTAGNMGIIDVEIGPRTGSLDHAEKAISDSSLAYVKGSSVDKMDLYVKEIRGANHYQMSVVEMIAGAAIIWDTTSSAVTAPTDLVSIT